MNGEESKEKFEPQGTKISPAMAVVWNAVCEALGTDTYHMLQHFIYAMIRAASSQHDKSPEIQKLLDLLDLDPGWQNAINLCAPNGKLTIEQMILIVSQEDKNGFGMVMLDKPYCGECRQTENVSLIIERAIQVGTKKLYQKLRDIGKDMDCERFLDVMLTMIAAQDLLNTEQDERDEMPQYGEYHDHGKKVVYGKKFKRVQHKTPDTIEDVEPVELPIQWTDDDREIAEYEAKNWEGEYRNPVNDEPPRERDLGDEIDEALGCRPFGYES